MLHIKITKNASDSAFRQIRKLVEDAQSSRAHLQLITDRLASYFVPAVIAVAFVVFFIWIGVELSAGAHADALPFALKFAVTLLVVACPCALALAVPTAVMTGMEVGAKLGIIYKGGGEALETLHKTTTVVFDKTGTLTHGKPAVVGFQLCEKSSLMRACEGLGGEKCGRIASDCHACAEYKFFAVVGSAESASEHPVGKAIYQHSRLAYAFEAVLPINFTSVPGKGLSCKVINPKMNVPHTIVD